MEDVVKLCQINIFGLRSANKKLNDKEEDLVEQFLENLQLC